MNWIRSLFAPARVVDQPIPVPFGSDLILTVDLTAQQDALALIGAIQEQFPASRIHLLSGFGSVQVLGQKGSSNGEAARHESHQEISIEQDAANARAQYPQLGAQGNVVLLRHCAGGRIVAVSVPPKKQGDAGSEAVFHGGTPDGVISKEAATAELDCRARPDHPDASS